MKEDDWCKGSEEEERTLRLKKKINKRKNKAEKRIDKIK